MTNDRSTLLVVLLTLGVVLLAIIALLMSCYKFTLVSRIQRAYWRYNNERRSRNGVFTVKTSEDQGDLTNNKIYKLGVSKPEPIRSTDSPPVSPFQKDNTFLLTEDMQTDVKETVSSREPTLRKEEIREEDKNDFLDETSDDDDLQASYYMPMDRPRGIRKCYTFSGAPSKPCSVDESVNNDSPLLSHESVPGIHFTDYSRSTYITARSVPVARCSPIRTKNEKENDIMAEYREKAKTIGPMSGRKLRNSVAEVIPSPVIRRPRKVYQDDFDLNASLSDSDDDLFKEAWWRSSLSINSEDLLRDDHKRPQWHTRDSASRSSSYTGSIYVQMEEGSSPNPCTPLVVAGKRDRSMTMPCMFEDHPRYSPGDMASPCFSLWYPVNLSGNLQFKAELRPPPRPCSTMPHYVNFRGTLPQRH